MSKKSSQKEARRRRKERAREMRDLGRVAAEKLAVADKVVAGAESSNVRLQVEMETLRREHVELLHRETATKTECNSLGVLLDGLRAELSSAASVVVGLEDDKTLLVAKVARLEEELAAAREADIEAKPLRVRLQNKSKEIDELRLKLQVAQSQLSAARGAPFAGWDRLSSDSTTSDAVGTSK